MKLQHNLCWANLSYWLPDIKVAQFSFEENFPKKCHFQIISDVQWWTKKFHPFLDSTYQESGVQQGGGGHLPPQILKLNLLKPGCRFCRTYHYLPLQIFWASAGFESARESNRSWFQLCITCKRKEHFRCALFITQRKIFTYIFHKLIHFIELWFLCITYEKIGVSEFFKTS